MLIAYWPEQNRTPYQNDGKHRSSAHKTTAQVALNWLLTKDDHIIPIPGAKNQHQATDNAAATGWRLTFEEFRQIDQASREL